MLFPLILPNIKSVEEIMGLEDRGKKALRKDSFLCPPNRNRVVMEGCNPPRFLRLSPRSDNFYEKRPLVYYIPLLADYKCRNRLDPASDIEVPNESAWSCKNSLLAYSTNCGWQAPEDARLIRSLNVPGIYSTF